MPASTSAFLDNLDAIREIDQSNVLGSAQSLADQIADAWDQVQSVEVKLDAKKVRNIVVSGMGGSALGPDVIKRAFKAELHVPIEVVNDYALPGYVDEHSLVILSSYSGTTEETLAASEDAQARGAQIMGITTGGGLLEFLQKHGHTAYQMDARFNPSNQPRMAIGYSVFGIVALLTKAGLLKLTDTQVNGIVAAVKRMIKEIDINVSQENNQAKQTAFSILARVPVLVAAEHLEGAVHVFQNQLNENAKTYAEYRVIPELNHHLMEGLRFPESLDNSLYFLLFNSSLYHERTQKRVDITQKVIENAGIEAMPIQLEGESRLEQVFEVIAFGAFTNFYLAMLEGIDPAPIPTVDYFKDELKKA